MSREISPSAKKQVEEEIRRLAAELHKAIDPPGIHWSSDGMLSFTTNRDPTVINLSSYDLTNPVDGASFQAMSALLRRHVERVRSTPSGWQEKHNTK